VGGTGLPHWVAAAEARRRWIKLRRPTQDHVQITPICVTLAGSNDTREDAPNGGSARDYQGLSARLAISTTDEQAGGPGRMFMQGQRWA
jgi:hypothetical protein